MRSSLKADSIHFMIEATQHQQPYHILYNEAPILQSSLHSLINDVAPRGLRQCLRYKFNSTNKSDKSDTSNTTDTTTECCARDYLDSIEFLCSTNSLVLRKLSICLCKIRIILIGSVYEYTEKMLAQICRIFPIFGQNLS